MHRLLSLLVLGLTAWTGIGHAEILWYSTNGARVSLGTPSAVTRGLQGITLTTGSSYFGGYVLDLDLDVPSNVEVTGLRLCYSTSGSATIYEVDLYESGDPSPTLLHDESPLASASYTCTTLAMTPHVPAGPFMASVKFAIVGPTTVRLGAIGLEVQPLPLSVVGPAMPPSRFGVGQSIPNPTSEAAVIEFELPVEESAWVEIYDVEGRLVRSIDSTGSGAGRQAVRWDTRDAFGQRVAPGVYFYWVVSASGSSESRRLTVVR
jgi:hypothetical protein